MSKARLVITAVNVEKRLVREVARTYVLDSDMQAFFARSNPWALRDMSGRLLEAMDRGLWAEPEPALRAALEQAFLGAEELLESRAEHELSGASV